MDLFGVLLGDLTLLLFGTAQPFFGRLTFGMCEQRGVRSRGCLIEKILIINRTSIEIHALHSCWGGSLWIDMCD